ncbi:Crp/Fnr family transcriptional regulator [Variovorax sp. J22R133]|uniref:Crp/Fnr family transcriptional regulator n=1 Tax=Variovorax brevis TaxID=3053503 RepID=UPI00257747C8|nr:Crp/Fnr family transcriptional regulator [Variovorax sp. J22R133]MDM0112904.1 Crp/Fnr family transcriptional regulator [Variovorax sp. J22R133]
MVIAWAVIRSVNCMNQFVSLTCARTGTSDCVPEKNEKGGRHDGEIPCGQAMRFAHIVRLIENLPLFRGLDEELIRRIASEARMVRVLRRDVIYRKGDVCSGFHVVSYGCVRLSLFSSKGVEKPIQVASAGSSFGEPAMLRGMPHDTTSIAVEDSGLIFIPKEAVLTLLQSDWRLGMRMLANLSHRLHQLIDDIDDFLLQPPAARLVSYLLRLVPPNSLDANNIQLTLHKHLVAAQLNLKPETLSRYFRQFCADGLIELRGNCVTIFNVVKLRQYGVERPA